MGERIPDNVVSIETRFAEAPPVELLQWRYDACRHAHTYLDATLRTVGCRDCGEERLDPFEVLSALAAQWRAWQREAETLRKLNAEYHANRRATWERARDRHLGARPDHRDVLEADLASGVLPRNCRPCYSLVLHHERRWDVPAVPEG